MSQLDRITNSSPLSRDKACIRETGVTVATVLTLLAEGQSQEDILALHSNLEGGDIEAVLDFLKAVFSEGSSTRVAANLGIKRRTFMMLMERFAPPRPRRLVKNAF